MSLKYEPTSEPLQISVGRVQGAVIVERDLPRAEAPGQRLLLGESIIISVKLIMTRRDLVGESETFHEEGSYLRLMDLCITQL